jgi:thiamine kinase-like enzyme
MPDVITEIEQVTPEWLTGVLRKSGALERGQVAAIEKDTSRPFGSIVSRLAVNYTEDTLDSAPRRLFLKIANPETHQDFPERGRHELEFYSAIPNSDAANLPIPRCYDIAFSAAGFHLLMDDLAQTHFLVPHPLPPSQSQCEQVADSLARLHAYWWDHAMLDTKRGNTALFFGVESAFAGFADFLGDRLWDERRGIYERVLAEKSRLEARFADDKRLTLVHGDAHAWNFLYPHTAERHNACLVDWEAWGVDVAPYDLAYMIALFWFPAHRARAETSLVRRYYDHLVEYDVRDYAWEDCWNDYRLSIIRNLFMPVFWWNEQRDSDFWPELWWPRLERVMCAYDDLHCDELLS